MSHIYRLRYKIECPVGGRTADQAHDDAKLEHGGWSATDALLMASILYPEDGSLSVLFIGRDGRTGQDTELADHEWFKVWTMLTGRLAQSKTLSPVKKEFCQTVFDTFATAMRAQREEDKSRDG